MRSATWRSTLGRTDTAWAAARWTTGSAGGVGVPASSGARRPALARAASPRRALLALQDCVQNMEAARGDASPLFVEPILALVVELAGASGRAARVLAADPALAVELAGRLAPEAHADAEPFERHMERILRRTAGDTVAFDRALRRFRNRQMLRLALWELRDTDVRLTAAEVADLASASLQGTTLQVSAVSGGVTVVRAIASDAIVDLHALVDGLHQAVRFQVLDAVARDRFFQQRTAGVAHPDAAVVDSS